MLRRKQKTKLNRLIDDSISVFFFFVVCLSLALVAQFFMGCTSTAPVPTPPAPKYELTLTGSIDGVPFQGVGVGSTASHHDMVISSAISVNYFTVESCHRSLQFSDVISIGWLGTGHQSYAWSYDEAPTIEDTGDCILRFCAFSKAVGSAPSACAIVDFHSPRFILPGQNICNGVNGSTSGTAICHTQVGLIERFQFPVPVVQAPQIVDPTGKTSPYWITNQCQGTFLDAAQTLWEYKMPAAECVAIFMEKALPNRMAKLTVIPYDQAQYQGAQ
jgi:hypothetical protein